MDRHEEEQRPLREAGQGEAEGFELAEEELIEHATHGDEGGSPADDAYTVDEEAERSGAVYGEADHERSSELDEDEEEGEEP